MSNIPFHLTAMGRDFYDKTIPELVEQLTQLNLNMAHLRIILLDLASSAKKIATAEARKPKSRKKGQR